MKVNEIFFSIQGEGFHAGKPAIFIRLSDCNLRCNFCDTEFLSGTEMYEGDIIRELKKWNCSFVIITGGEPGIHDLKNLCDQLRDRKYYVAIETNGMHKIPGTIDWVTCSPKTIPKSIILDRIDELKFVIAEGDEVPDQYSYRGFNELSTLLWISPQNNSSNSKIGTKGCMTINKKNTKYCTDMVKRNPQFMLNIQIQKIIGVR